MTDKERKFKDSSFEMSLENGSAIVRRKINFAGADIEFKISLKPEGGLGNATVAELHQQSVKEVIALLQTTIPADK